MDFLVEYDTNPLFEYDEEKDIVVDNAGHYTISSRDYSTLRPYGRKDYQIIYISKGSMGIVYNGRHLRIGEGNLVIYKPGERQEYTFLHDPDCEIHWIHFYGKRIPSIMKDLKIDNIAYTNIGIDYKIPKIITSCMSDLITHKFGCEYLCSGNLLRLLAYIGQAVNSAEHSVDNMPVEKFYEVLLKMRDSSSSTSLEEYAEICSMSVSRFSHLFKETFGESPYCYQTKIKIDKAKSLLASSSLSIKEISAFLGYDDAYYFSRIFKKYTGKSPKRFRQDNETIGDDETEELIMKYNIPSGKSGVLEETDIEE